MWDLKEGDTVYLLVTGNALRRLSDSSDRIKQVKVKKVGRKYVTVDYHKNTEELEDYVIIQFRPELSRAVRWYKRIDNHNILFYHGDLNITDVKLIELGGEHE